MKYIKSYSKYLLLEEYHIENRVITLGDIVDIHNKLVRQYGGMEGIRDMNQLKSCVDKPYMSAFEQDIYPTIYDKAACVLESIMTTHPFTDGNKRTAFTCMTFILEKEGIKFDRTYDQCRRYIVNIVDKEKDVTEIAEWLRDNSIKA